MRRGDFMDTAKVDIRKLQILNDRIAQTIDALNQVRLSVHGVSASPSALGYGAVSPFFGAPGIGHSGGWAPQFASPLSMMNPFYSQLWSASLSPYAAAASNPYAAAAYNPAAAAWGASLGIGHSSPADYASAAAAQAAAAAQIAAASSAAASSQFPFAAWGYSPYANSAASAYGSSYGIY
jgi:hypothetical protein